MSETVKVRVTQNCEHGEKGKVLEVDADRLPAWLAEGKVERYEEPSSAKEPGPEFRQLDELRAIRDKVQKLSGIEPAKPAPARKAAPKKAPPKPKPNTKAKPKGKKGKR